MAYSSITIEFNSVPSPGSSFTITETDYGSMTEVFKGARDATGEVALPNFQGYDGVYPERYVGYVSSKYKAAFDLDYNTSNLLTVTAINGPTDSGTGTVTIVANYPDAFFTYSSLDVNVTVTINNETFTPTAPSVIAFTPTTINFNHEQNTSFETKAIAISGDLWKVVGKPNFVLSSLTAGVTVATLTDGSGTYQSISGSGSAIVSITPTIYYDSSVTFLPTDLSGTFAILKNNVAYSTIAFTMVVTRLSDYLSIPYLATAKAFTKDLKFFEFSSSNADTYFQFDSTIKTCDFGTNAVHEYFIPLKIVLFNGKAKENLGQIIHRLMRKFTEVNDTLLQYKEASLQISCSEISIADETVIRSGTSAVIPFIAGLSRGITTLGFLDFNPLANRVTKRGFAYLNILIPSGSYELRTFKNGTLVGSAALPASTGTVLCKKVVFSDYEKGDVIQFVIDVVGQINDTAPKKTYILYPDNNYSNMIVWENEFLVQSAIECTGTASLVPEGEFQSQTIYVDLVERLEHLSTSKEVKLYINTGWLLFSDIDTVESLMRSKRAWLIQGNDTISLRPISKKLPKKDLEEELIQYPLEFKINQSYDEETYSL
jgi:hypothetical protein